MNKNEALEALRQMQINSYNYTRKHASDDPSNGAWTRGRVIGYMNALKDMGVATHRELESVIEEASRTQA